MAKKKNRVIIALARGIPESPAMTRLRLKIMDFNKRIDDRCAQAKVVADNDPDVLKVSQMRKQLSELSAKEILGNKF